MMSEGRFFVAMVVISLCLLAISGCSQKRADERTAEKMMEKVLEGSTGKHADVKIGKGKVEIEANGSKTEIVETTAWPPEMFKDVPQFTLGRIERVVKSLEEGGRKKFNIYYVDIERDGVTRYADLLDKGGWQASVMQMGDKGTMLNAQKGSLAVNFPHNLADKRGTLIVYDLE